MEREKIVELMKSANIPVGKAGVEWWELVDGVPTQIARLIDLVEKETLERAAKHFDDRGKYADGSWSLGWYDPESPGIILRTLKTSGQ